MSCIYKITNLVNNKIYIGLTMKDINYRWRTHLKCLKSKSYQSSLIGKAIRKYGKDNFKIEEIISGNIDRNKLGELEKYYIKLFNTTNTSIGYNLNQGGFGGKTYERTSIIRKQISDKLKGHSYNKGNKHSQFTKDNISKALKKLSESNIRWSTCKYVYQYDLNYNLINKFNSVKEASSILNINKDTILNISKGKTKNPRCGFLFKIIK